MLGAKDTQDLGGELADKAKMISAAREGMKPNGSDDTPAPAPVKSPADKINAGAKYGDKPGEKRLDTSDWTKPLKGQASVYHEGVKVVPKTGPAILEKGEKVIKKEDNPDNPDNHADKTEVDDMTSEHSPAEKAHFHRAMSKLHAGGLHDALGISHGEKIPLEKKEAAANSDNPHTAAMGRMAVAMHGWKHGKK